MFELVAQEIQNETLPWFLNFFSYLYPLVFPLSIFAHFHVYGVHTSVTFAGVGTHAMLYIHVKAHGQCQESSLAAFPP